MEKYAAGVHPDSRGVKGTKSDMCDHPDKKHKQGKTSNWRSQQVRQHHQSQSHHRRHYRSDESLSQGLHSAEENIGSDHHQKHRHLSDNTKTSYLHHHKQKNRHVSVSEMSSFSTSSSSTSTSLSSSSTSLSSSSSSSSSSFTSSTASSSSSMVSSKNGSESSGRHAVRRTQLSQSCTDISRKQKSLEEGDDMVPLIKGHQSRSYAKQRRKSKSSQSCLTKGSSEKRRTSRQSLERDGSVRKTKSMDNLTTPRDKEKNESKNENKQGLNMCEVRKNVMKEKMKFSAFLNEITRQVLSPMRLSTLGVTDAQRPCSPGQISNRSREADISSDKLSQQRSRPASAESISSSKQSYSGKHSHSPISQSKSFPDDCQYSASQPSYTSRRRRSSHSRSPTSEHHCHFPCRHHPHGHHNSHHEGYEKPDHQLRHRDHHTTGHHHHRRHHRSPVNKHQDYQNPHSEVSQHWDYYNPTQPHGEQDSKSDHHCQDHSHQEAYHVQSQDRVHQNKGHHTRVHHHQDHHSQRHHHSNHPNSHVSQQHPQEHPKDHHCQNPSYHHGNQHKRVHPAHEDHHGQDHYHSQGDCCSNSHQHHRSRSCEHPTNDHYSESQHHHGDHHHKDHKNEPCDHPHEDLHSQGHHHHEDHHGPGHHHHHHHHGDHYGLSHSHYHRTHKNETRGNPHEDYQDPGHHHHHHYRENHGHPHHHEDCKKEPRRFSFEDHHTSHHDHEDHLNKSHQQDQGEHHSKADQHHQKDYHKSSCQQHLESYPEPQTYCDHVKNSDLNHEVLDDHNTASKEHLTFSTQENSKSNVSKHVSHETTNRPSSQKEEQTSFTGPSILKEKKHGFERIMILQDQNEGLHQSLMKTAVRMECLGEEFLSGQKLLETELQRTRMELNLLMDKFKRLHDTCSSTQQSNTLLEQKLHSVARNMESERERLNLRISELTQQLTDTKLANNMEALNVTSESDQTNFGSHPGDVISQTVSSITPPPAQFMDCQNFGRDTASGQEQALGSVPEEEESDWSEMGEDAPRIMLTGSNRGQSWRHQEVDMDKDSESGGEDIIRCPSPRPMQIPQLQFTVHNEFLPPCHSNASLSGFKNLSSCILEEECYRITNPNLKSAILIRSASLEEIPLARHDRQEELRGTRAMIYHSEDENVEDMDNEIIHHWRMSGAKDTVVSRMTESRGPGMGLTETNLASLQSAERMLNHLICNVPFSEERKQSGHEVHGWAGGIPDEMMKGERTQL